MAKNEAKEKRINDILSAAIDLIVEKGYENTSMNEIAARAGISKGGLYHHFLSKDLVLLQANQKLLEPIDELMENAKNYPSAREGFKYYISAYLTYWVSRKKELAFFSLSMTKALNQRDIFHMYQKYVEDYLSFFIELFNKGIKNGEFIEHDSRTNAVALMSALDGATIYLVLDKKIQLQTTADGFLKLFVDSVLAQ